MTIEDVRRWLTTGALCVLALAATVAVLGPRDARAGRHGVQCTQVQSLLESGTVGGDRQIELAASTLLAEGAATGMFGVTLERWTYVCAFGEDFGSYTPPATPRKIDNSELDDPESFLRGR